jgi:glutamate-1-semialdehyde 2,1-aminomutase
MSAVRLARGYTGRDFLVKFEGCYHGHVDSLMVNSGSGLATFGIASSPGIPSDTVSTTLVAPLNDIEAVEYLFSEHGTDIAAIVIEPLPANNGLLVQSQEFLSKLRELCDSNGALLIFDEVISGFRFKQGSYGDICGVTPDITALGKVIGGGLPVGAYGARTEIMEQLSPLGPVYQAGTLSGNPLAMAAGIKTLDLLDDDAYDRLEELGKLLQDSVEPILNKHGYPMRLVRLGSLFWFSPGRNQPPSRADLIPSNAGELYSNLHKALLDRGYMLAPSAYEIGFIATVHEEKHILGMVEALDEALGELEW